MGNIKNQDLTFEEHVKQDHAEIFAIYDMCKAAPDNAQKQAYANSLVRLLAIHSVAEECALYTQYEKYLPYGATLAQNSRKEHQQIKENLYMIDGMSCTDTQFDSTLDLIMSEIKTHAKDEEDISMPRMRAAMTLADAIKLGRDFEFYKSLAPTHPHPMASDKGGVLEKMAGFMAKPVDMLRDATRTFAQ